MSEKCKFCGYHLSNADLEYGFCTEAIKWPNRKRTACCYERELSQKEAANTELRAKIERQTAELAKRFYLARELNAKISQQAAELAKWAAWAFIAVDFVPEEQVEEYERLTDPESK